MLVAWLPYCFYIIVSSEVKRNLIIRRDLNGVGWVLSVAVEAGLEDADEVDRILHVEWSEVCGFAVLKYNVFHIVLVLLLDCLYSIVSFVVKRNLERYDELFCV